MSEKISDYLANRLLKRLLKYRLEFASEYQKYPKTISVGLNRPPLFTIKVEIDNDVFLYSQRTQAVWNVQISLIIAPSTFRPNGYSVRGYGPEYWNFGEKRRRPRPGIRINLPGPTITQIVDRIRQSVQAVLEGAGFEDEFPSRDEAHLHMDRAIASYHRRAEAHINAWTNRLLESARQWKTSHADGWTRQHQLTKISNQLAMVPDARDKIFRQIEEQVTKYWGT